MPESAGRTSALLPMHVSLRCPLLPARLLQAISFQVIHSHADYALLTQRQSRHASNHFMLDVLDAMHNAAGTVSCLHLNQGV